MIGGAHMNMPIGQALWDLDPAAEEVVLRLAWTASTPRAALDELQRLFPAALADAEQLQFERLRTFGRCLQELPLRASDEPEAS